MFSGRRESVMRHINNPRIHSGRALTIPFIDYISGIRNRIQGPSLNDHFYPDTNTEIKTPNVENGLFDRLWKEVEQIHLKRTAESIVNTWQYQGQYSGGVLTGSRSTIRRIVHYAGEKIFAIRGAFCSKCFTIEPIILGYGSSVKANIASVSDQVHIECRDEFGMPETQVHNSLKYISTNGFPQAIREWIKTMWSSNGRMRIVALMLPDPEAMGEANNNTSDKMSAKSASSHSGTLKGERKNSILVKLIFDDVNKSCSLPQEKREITFSYNSSDFFDLINYSELRTFEPISNEDHIVDKKSGTTDKSIIEKAIESSDLTIGTESELLEFLRYTKFGTFGFFKISSPTWNSVFSQESGFYLLFLSPPEFSAGGKFHACASTIEGSVF
ncbi:MAG TPA: hypothetical protein VH415_00895 [Nitrososphaeraceae archaeon]|jgi:hypothetical protein